MFNRKRNFIIVAGLCLLGLLSPFSPAVFADSDNNQAQLKRIELINRRSAHSMTYRNENGTDTVRVSSTPLFYQNNQNRWTEIDTSLEPATAGENDEDGNQFAYRSIRNSFRTYFPRQSRGWVTLKSGQNVLAFKLVSNKNREFNKEQNGITVHDILDNCSLNYLVKPGALKETLTLKNPLLLES